MHFLDLFCALASDPCVNVRIQLSESIAKTYIYLQNESRINETVQRLQVDSCRDVKGPVASIKIVTETLSSGVDIELFVRGMLD